MADIIWQSMVIATPGSPDHVASPPDGYRWAHDGDGFKRGECCWHPVSVHVGTVSTYVLWRRPAVPA